MANNLSVVEQAKADLLARGKDLSGPCGAFQITQLVAWRLGAGLLDKPGGNNCQGYAVDQVCFPDGSIYDVLGDAGNANTPSWPKPDYVDPSRYRKAIDPGFDTPARVPSPDPPPAPAPVPEVTALTAAQLAELRTYIGGEFEKVHQHLDQIVKDAEKTGSSFLPLLGKLFGR